MKRSKFLSILLLLSFIASPLFGVPPKAEAQSNQPISVSSAQQVQTSAPNDEIGASNTSGQMRTTTMAMRIAAALHLNLQRSGSTATYAGINPDTAKLSPMAKLGGQLAQMMQNLALPDYFGVANWANSPLPQLDANGAVIPGTGIQKFVDTLPGICGLPGATNGLGQCIPVGIPDQTTFIGSDYYEIAVVEYREQMSPDLPSPGTKLRGYVQIVPSTFQNAVPLTTANGLTMDIIDNQGNQVYGAYKPHYLGPMIVAQGCSLVANPTTCTPRPVRIKFTNYLPTGPAGDLFIPTDTTYMGAGMGPGGSIYSVTVTNGGTGYTSPSVSFTGGAGTGAAATATVINGTVTAVTVDLGGSNYTSAPTVSFTGDGGTGATATAVLAGQPGEMYTQNRATLHLHGGNTPWISDGTTHQWTTPYGEATSYSKGDSVSYVPDMWFDTSGNLYAPCAGQLTCPGYSNDPGLGSLTFYWTNQQSGRLLFYHDHAYGTTRLDVYAGEAAGYLIVDPTEEANLIAAGVPGTVPADLAHLVPLVIQDKTFVPDNGVAGGQLSLTDPTWDTTLYGSTGDLWFPHVYIPNQNPADVTGANAFGRWDYGPWFWPPQDPSGFIGQPYQCTSSGEPIGGWAFPPLMCPGTPNPSGTPEGFMDTPVINGALYPTLTVDPTSYRFQMLMAGNDRTWNLQLYVADPLAVAITSQGANYTLPPIVSFTGGGGSGATATAIMSNGTITSILLTDVGNGYTVAPNVTIADPGGGTGATATASIDPVTSTVSGIHITNGGSGYTSNTTVTIDPPGCADPCRTATATANVTAPGSVVGVTVTNPGTGWTSNPTVVFTNAPGDITGSGAAAIASINSEVKMVPAVPHDASSPVPLCTQAQPTSGALLAMAILDGNGNPVNGTGLPAGCWPTSWPHDGRDGGVPDPLTAGPPFIQIGSESGLLPAPVVIPSTPVNYNYNRRDITVLNVDIHGLLLGPAERADVIVDFSQYAGQTLLLYNDAPAPVPAFDSRNDYYTGDPDQTMAGGAPSTLPGYGPNTRTIMQIKVNAGGTAPINLTNVGNAVSATYVTQQNQMIIPEPQFPVGNGYSATPTYSRISDSSMPGWYNGQIGSLILTNGGSGYSSAPSVSFTGGGGTGATAALTFLGASVNNLKLLSGGSGYGTAPTVSIIGGGATISATATATIADYVSGVTVTNGGSGYSSAPTVNLTGGGGSGAAATANITSIVNNIAVTNGGTGYISIPTVDLTGGGGTGATATASLTNIVDTVAVVNGGSGYTSAPTVGFSGGGGSGAAATANLTSIVSNVSVTNGGSGFTSAPAVSFTGGGGSGAAGTASITNIVNSVWVSNGGSGYTSAPKVNLTGGSGTGAAASANITNVVNSVRVTNGGRNYSSAPTVVFTGGGGYGATARANVFAGRVWSVTVTNGGTGYTSPPTVSFIGGGGTGAAAVARLTGRVASVTVTNGGSGYTSAPTVTFTGGGGSGAVATSFITGVVANVAVTNSGTGYTSAPTVGFSGGGGSGAAATANMTGVVASITVTNGGSGYSTAPDVSISGGGGSGAVAKSTLTGAVGSITVTNGGSGYSTAPDVSISGGGGSGAAASASLTGVVASVTVTNGGTMYTSAPAVSFSGGGGSGAVASASVTGYVSGLLLTSGGSGYTSNPTVVITPVPGDPGSGATASATYLPGYVASLILTSSGTGYTSAPTVVFSDGGTPTIPAAAMVLAPVVPLQSKAIQELFTLDYGRMNATLGVELPFTNFFVQTTIPYGYVDPPTELFQSGDTQLWKITHNGVDTHFIHFHLYDVQVINRVGWDGMIKPPDVNEVGWKDTVRMNPLEDIIVALRPMKQQLPWELPNSYRPMDVTQPIGVSNPNNTVGFANIDPSNNPAPVTNNVINFGWEYVVHCHILGHEENDMMRAQLLAVPPDPVSNVSATLYNPGPDQYVIIQWTDGSINETGFTVQRAENLNGPWLSLPSAPAAPGTGTVMSYIDTSMARSTAYFYQVVANNVVGYTQTYAPPAIGYPTLSADSAPVIAPDPINTQGDDEPGPIFADSFETGLNQWSGVIGSSNVITQAVIGPNGGKYGMVAMIGPDGEPAYVYDTSPNAEVKYEGNFYFNPNKAVTDSPVDIFLGVDQNGQPIFGVQYQYIDANTFGLRAWALHNDRRDVTGWDVFATEPGEDDPVILTHKIDVAWASGVSGGLSFYVDDQLFRTLSGDTSAHQLEEVVLGPSLGLNANASGSMYFDEFTSSRVLYLTYSALLPVVTR